MSLEMEIPKILWLKNHLSPEMFSKCKFYDLPDFLTHRATGFDESRSYCSLVCKLAYVPEGVESSRFEIGWQRHFLGKIGLKELAEDLKPLGVIDGKIKVLSAGERVGYLSEESAQEHGLHTDVAVGSGVIDAYAGWVGTAAAKVPGWKAHKDGLEDASSRIASVAGTSTCHLVINKKAIYTKGHVIYESTSDISVWGPYREVLIPGYWMAEGGQSATGALLHHVLSSHAAYPAAKQTAANQNVTVFEFLNAHLETLRTQAKSPTLAHLTRYIYRNSQASPHLIEVYPDFAGNRSPLANANLRGSIHGLTLDADLDSLAFVYYATMEAIGHQTKHIINSLNEAGHQIKSIFMSGGQCKNKLLIQTISKYVLPFTIELRLVVLVWLLLCRII
jgi:FGGY-family pentulose kinase